MASRSLAACVLFAMATAGCRQILGIGDISLTGEDAGTDAGGVVPVVVASVMGKAPSGQAQQTKLVYATGSQRWWLFYIDGAEPKSLKTKYSADFVTWTDGQTLTLVQPHGGDGRSLSVAYANVSGTDVVHVVMSQQISLSDRRFYHTRATISGAAITFGAPVERFVVTASSTSLDPDGPVTVIGSDGHVTDLTSWVERANGTGDSYVARSASADEGSSWDGVWAPEVQLEIVKFAINAHGIVGMGAGALLAMWEDGALEGAVPNLRWSTWNEPAGWTAPPAEVFESPQLQSVNDWSAVSRTLADVHAVRRTTAAVDPYEHRRFDGLGWTNGQRIPLLEGKAGQGVFLATDGASVLLATLDAGRDNTVQVIRWKESGWGTWSTAVRSNADKTYLSGWSTVVDGRVGLIWTEPGPSGLVIAGALIAL